MKCLIDYDTLEPEGKEFFNICDNVLFRTRDFKKFEFVSTFLGNTRNGVMFPRKIDGYYWCAARPNSFTQSGSALMGQSTFLFRSKDLVDWEEVSLLFTAGHGWLCHGGPGFPALRNRGLLGAGRARRGDSRLTPRALPRRGGRAGQEDHETGGPAGADPGPL